MIHLIIFLNYFFKLFAPCSKARLALFAPASTLFFICSRADFGFIFYISFSSSLSRSIVPHSSNSFCLFFSFFAFYLSFLYSFQLRYASPALSKADSPFFIEYFFSLPAVFLSLDPARKVALLASDFIVPSQKLLLIVLTLLCESDFNFLATFVILEALFVTFFLKLLPTFVVFNIFILLLGSYLNFVDLLRPSDLDSYSYQGFYFLLICNS